MKENAAPKMEQSNPPIVSCYNRGFRKNSKYRQDKGRTFCDFSVMQKMSSFLCEECCIPQLISIHYQRDCIGLCQQTGLMVSDEWISSILESENGLYYRYEYNVVTKKLKTSKKEKDNSDYLYIDNSIEQSISVIDVSNNGTRWEGPCTGDSSSGYGSLYSSSNELIYRGVMIGGEKECFGTEFYPDLGKPEYCGCYWDNERHGFGMLYDRKGELLYEGVFICGSPDYDKNVILKDLDNDRIVHSFIHELVIDEGCGNDYEGDLLLCGFDYLERIVVKKNSLKNLSFLKISDNCVLKSIEIKDGEYSESSGSFWNVRKVMMESVIIE